MTISDGQLDEMSLGISEGYSNAMKLLLGILSTDLSERSDGIGRISFERHRLTAPISTITGQKTVECATYHFGDLG